MFCTHRHGWSTKVGSYVGRIFRERLSALEAAASPTGTPPSLSLHSLCRSLTRSQAARLFYQVCGAQLPTLCGCLCMSLRPAIEADAS